MNQDSFSKITLREGRKLLEAGAIRNLQFVDGIYQFTIKAAKGKKFLYPVLHVDEKGILIDALCDCSKSVEQRSCVHIAAAWLKIFEHSYLPMHVRFRDSFWNSFFKIAAGRHACALDDLKKKNKEQWQILSSSGQALFVLKALNKKGQKRVAEFLSHPKKAQENSLKFSSLSPEEHFMLREGKAPFALRYRLSPWSELAEWCFLKQEMQEKYRIHFLADEDSLPQEIQIRFSDMEITLLMMEENWPELISKIPTVSSPLQTFTSQYAPIRAISYDEANQQLKVSFASSPMLAEGDRKKNIVLIDQWFFIAGLGFFPAHRDPLLGEKQLSGGKIAEFFDRYLSIAQATLVGTRIYPTQHSVKYSLGFIEKKGLKISGYLFEPGDLDQPGVAQFGEWVYLPGHGFYKISASLKVIHKMIPLEKLSSFIAQHRLFLAEHEGFQIHLTTIEAALSFHVDEEGSLLFDLSLEEGLEQEGVYDLGEWVYIHSRGFYPKAKQSGIIRAGLVITKRELSLFIDRNRLELETLSGFFASHCPIETSGLIVFLNEEKRIVISPRYEMAPAYTLAAVRILGDYTYVKGEGFYEIPAPIRLPDVFVQKRTIGASQEAHFIMHQLETLSPFLLEVDQRLIKPERLFLKLLKFKKSAAFVPSWHLEFLYKSEFGEVSLSEIKQAISKKQSYLFTPAGLIMLDLPRFTWIKELAAKAFKKDSGRITLTTLECLKLAAFEEVVDKQGKVLAPEDWQALFERHAKAETASLKGLKSILRPYQAKGFEWLWVLHMQGLSGLLCDEMGLGKTHQAMALIAALRNQTKEGKKGRKLFLVVCPTSVIFHWQELFQRFLPGARVLVFHGIQRNANRLEEDPEIVITSYGILRSEKALFKKLEFTLAILDEIQMAKNTNSLTHKILKQLDANMRLGLTGTPIENRLLDLKALFDIILPNYLPSHFEQLFQVNGGVEMDPKHKELLRHLVRPFILRRRKSEVLTELPEKTEELYYCVLSAEQVKLYNEVLRVDAEGLLSELKDENKSVSYLHIFTILTRLKQICDHPCLVLPEVENYFSHHSGKWELFVELLSEARESGQKVVVFSQFLKMLDIIEAYLDERNIGHAGIRGSTRDRQAEVHRFRDDPNCEVFVASLQAAGVGIDLVAASVVIHYDRWWNPAKENQATDRVHRIGQQRGVQVFKLIAKNTIEEHIDRLIQRKTKLLREAVGFDDQETLKQFDRSELIEVLQSSLP